MVKLPTDDLDYKLQSLREWVYRYERDRNMVAGPVRLVELEVFSDLAASYMQNTQLSNSNINAYLQYRQTAMNRIRQLFNMEFKLRCDVCGMAHYQDEITAPER